MGEVGIFQKKSNLGTIWDSKKSKISDRGGGSSLFWKNSKIFPFFNYEISPKKVDRLSILIVCTLLFPCLPIKVVEGSFCWKVPFSGIIAVNTEQYLHLVTVSVFLFQSWKSPFGLLFQNMTSLRIFKRLLMVCQDKRKMHFIQIS